MNLLINFYFSLFPQKEEKSQQHKVRKGATQLPPVQTTVPPKPSSPDALKASIASVVTVSNINIGMDEDLIKRQVQEPQSGASRQQAVNEPVIHSRERQKLDSSAPPVNFPVNLSSVTGDVSGGGDEGRVSNGVLHTQQQEMSKPGDTFYVCREKQTAHTDNTMELLKDADSENTGVALKVNRDITTDTVTLLKRAPTQHTSDLQVSAQRE